MIDKNRYGIEPFSDQQHAAIRRLRAVPAGLAPSFSIGWGAIRVGDGMRELGDQDLGFGT